MKSLYFTTLICISAVIVANAQTYSIFQSAGTYTELANPVDATGGELWDDDFWTIPVGFNMPVFDQYYSSLTFDSDGFFVDSLIGADTTELIVGLSKLDMVDGAFLIDWTNPIPITYETSGTIGNQIFKIQWKTAMVWGNDDDYLNYQIWFYENSGNIEYHFGDMFLTIQPVISVHLLTSGAFLDDGLCLTGDPLAATGVDIREQKLDGTPPNGSIYTFVREGSSPDTSGQAGTTSMKPISAEKGLVSMFPNPTINGFYLSGLSKNVRVELYNVTGTRVKTLYNVENNTYINISALQAGVYFVNVLSEEGSTFVLKLVKR